MYWASCGVLLSAVLHLVQMVQMSMQHSGDGSEITQRYGLTAEAASVTQQQQQQLCYAEDAMSSPVATVILFSPSMQLPPDMVTFLQLYW